MFVRPLLGAWVAMVLLLGLAPRAAQAGDSMRCGSRIVTVEARAADILAACGDPAYRDIYSWPAPRLPGEVADVEQWTYNFGRNQLLHVLKLRHGRLVDIRTDGYGFAAAARPGRCDSGSIAEGLSKYRLLAACGEPFTRRTVGYVTALQPRHRHQHGGWNTSRGHIPVEVFREEWVYNFGSNQFLRIVTIEDGVVAEVDNGERGFNPR
jgi:hypothetical protein